MDYEKKYNKLVEAIKVLQETNPSDEGIKNWVNDNVPELKELDDEKIRKGIISGMKALQEKGKYTRFANIPMDDVFVWLEKQGTSYTKRDVDDAYVEGMAFAKNELEKQKSAWSEEDEKIRDEICIYIGAKEDISLDVHNRWLTWLEKQGKQHSAIRWHDVSLIPQENEELLVEWDSEDATWHEIAFYRADTKTFWNGKRQVENVTRWCYIIDWVEKQGEPTEINPSEFDLRLNKLLKQFESLPKEELISNLSYYLNVIQNDGTYKIEKQGEQKVSYTTIVETGDGGINAFVTRELPTDGCDDEQKPTDKVEPKFKMEKGKWYVCDTSRYTDFIVGKAYYCPKNGMLKPNENAIARYVAKDCFHLWTIEDAKDGDVLVDEDINVIGIFEGTEGMCWHSKIYYSYATKELYGIECGGSHQKEFAKPATKEQRDLLFQKMHEAGYEWDAEKKELKKIEGESENYKQQIMSEITDLVTDYIRQKPSWSEEDEQMIDNIIDYMKPMPIFFESTKGKSGKEYTQKFVKNAINWLKSLKRRTEE